MENLLKNISDLMDALEFASGDGMPIQHRTVVRDILFAELMKLKHEYDSLAAVENGHKKYSYEAHGSYYGTS